MTYLLMNIFTARMMMTRRLVVMVRSRCPEMIYDSDDYSVIDLVDDSYDDHVLPTATTEKHVIVIDSDTDDGDIGLAPTVDTDSSFHTNAHLTSGDNSKGINMNEPATTSHDHLIERGNELLYLIHANLNSDISNQERQDIINMLEVILDKSHHEMALNLKQPIKLIPKDVQHLVSVIGQHGKIKVHSKGTVQNEHSQTHAKPCDPTTSLHSTYYRD
ncbi:uncharacterized protein BX664DRAFT_40949 [Halteromyces radiatus]|uniref:uncharacterized protein n=1 Tax=Halteromyces radiatus TaxID=101107 RepID=UPI00221E652C|nr:uncharacterized protein BX664DRAFT_40949 [Halteromyces radiatus]KAI8078899.1 hypothetical protein BX664DRAFT_40949 [Halteromyces radiatus]